MYDWLVLLSEVVLSAYPLLITQVNVSVMVQTGLRMAIFTVLAATAAAASGSPLLAASLWSSESIATGFLNLVHVGSSYTAFEQLPAGNAMALFYLYPVFNILGAAAVLGESLPYANLPWIAVAFAGALLLAQPTPTHWTLVGVLSAILAAATETGIYLWFKASSQPSSAAMTDATVKASSSQPSSAAMTDATVKASTHEVDTQPWTKMIQMYGSSGVLWALFAVVFGSLGYLAKNTFRLSTGSLSAIVLFNALIGFTGYALRFFLIPRVSTVVFSVLSFFGVVSAYGLGWLVQGDVPTLTQLAGAIAIIVSNGILLSKETV